MDRKQLKQLNQSRKISQVCYVTDDYKKVINFLYSKLKFGPWTIITHSDKFTHAVELEGETVSDPFLFYCAFTFVGEVQIEIIQPVYGDTPYDEFLQKKGPGIHHIKESCDDNTGLYTAVNNLIDDGEKIYYKGEYQDDLFFYFDFFRQIGSAYELGNRVDVQCHPGLVGYYP